MTLYHDYTLNFALTEFGFVISLFDQDDKLVAEGRYKLRE